MGRGLSTLQKDIMEIATVKGYVTPAQAAERASSHQASSRAIARLIQRGLLFKDDWSHCSWGTRYRLTGWCGALPTQYYELCRAEPVFQPPDLGDMLVRMQATALSGNS